MRYARQILVILFMPLENAPVGSKGFGRNVATEIKAGKPEKQAVATAYQKARGDETYAPAQKSDRPWAALSDDAINKPGDKWNKGMEGRGDALSSAYREGRTHASLGKPKSANPWKGEKERKQYERGHESWGNEGRKDAERDLEGPSTTEGAFDSQRSRAAIAQDLHTVEKDLEELSRAGRSKAYTALCRKRDNLEDELKNASKDSQFPMEPTAAMLAKLDAMLSCADSVIADTNDKLSNKTEEEIAPDKCDDMPRSAFLRPSERKYPVKSEKDGAWCYDHKLLVAAAREARMHGDEDLANEADKLREKEFAGRSDGGPGSGPQGGEAKKQSAQREESKRAFLGDMSHAAMKAGASGKSFAAIGSRLVEQGISKDSPEYKAVAHSHEEANNTRRGFKG